MMNTLNQMKRFGMKIAIGAAMLATMPTMVGCQKHDPEVDETKNLTGIPGDQFESNYEPRRTQRILDAAAASGARADATLYSAHFDAGNPSALSSLGEAKLELMLSDDDALPVAIYLNVADDELMPVREQSVKVYLRDRGLAENQIKLVAGPKTGNSSPVKHKLRDAQTADMKGAAATAAENPGTGAAK